MLTSTAINAPTNTVARVSESLSTFDPALFSIIQAERINQNRCCSLIASENYTPKYCNDALSSCLSMKYSEGYPGDRYYAGNQFIDQIERLCQNRALEAFNLDKKVWGVNVQSLSGTPANFAVYTALLSPGSRILYLDLPHGGHLSHGFGQGRVSATGRYFDCAPYALDPKTELIDYDVLAKKAKEFKPHLIVAGYSAYPRLLDYARFREIADSVGAILHADIAHIAGMMSAGIIPSAFPYCDVVTTTTHKTLRGPRGALIFTRKPLDKAVDKAVFPGCQGGPHNHTIAAIAAAMKACKDPEFVQYQKLVLSNAQALAETLRTRQLRLVTGGTDNHLLLADLGNKGVSGNQAEKALETVHIITNKNSTLRDKGAKNPNGLRIGTPAMTTRGMEEKGFKTIGNLLCDALEVSAKYSGSKLPKFVEKCQNDPTLLRIRQEVTNLLHHFPNVKSTLWQ
ncbi:serine hydroxymethyltransferase [Gregarina niphandrodes]|uniref:Serine hydroxymethyltransferase n=1 Tax=Gregarina niphandrodes TaxID=110365 RepID=A0A023BDC0_GRENI|nr:serine hydroxymethyltransferase [Gregarina niphandrodes]EZG87067.1 serine hydroxymethyltransferase [Gregarina niphandrodes]|eukprot:XP_011128709.1 serine hydroxymethyltransferase [Gregarina niphandrodes]